MWTSENARNGLRNARACPWWKTIRSQKINFHAHTRKIVSTVTISPTTHAVLDCDRCLVLMTAMTTKIFYMYLPLHPSGSSLLKFQNPGLQRSHLCPSTFVLHIQRPANKPASGSFFPSHSPPLTPPTESQLQAKNKIIKRIKLQNCTRWIVCTLVLIQQALYLMAIVARLTVPGYSSIH